ncbi:MAG: hypothetical protein NTX46_00570 [Chloroflexi bacterium]|nr:hypothetical protein [Chloroflexota bacterium]
MTGPAIYISMASNVVCCAQGGSRVALGTTGLQRMGVMAIGTLLACMRGAAQINPEQVCTLIRMALPAQLGVIADRFIYIITVPIEQGI